MVANVLKVYLGKHYFNTTNFGCQTATKEINPVDVQIFPNPTHNAIYIKTESLSKSLVIATLYDMKGLVIVKKTATFNNQQAILELPNPLSMGMYILTLSDEHGDLIKQTKILIE